jgi:hypothetical protein
VTDAIGPYIFRQEWGHELRDAIMAALGPLLDQQEAAAAWQPIATALKDRAVIVAFMCGREAMIGAAHWQHYSDGSEGWIGSSFWSASGSSWATVDRPTHWRPLPPPPEAVR